jgi:electron transfer flavoprotein alpha subunit
VRAIVVIDGRSGAGGAAMRQARALGAFLGDGLGGDVRRLIDHAQTVIFYADQGDREALLGLAPTRLVRLVRVARWRNEQVAAVLADLAAAEGAELFLFAGRSGPEPATRLACRAGGSVRTGVLDAEVVAGGLLVRTPMYSGHLVGRVALTARPWCLCVDASWADAGAEPPNAHELLAETDETARPEGARLDHVELIPAPSSDDLSASRFVVAAGRGAGSRQWIEGVAAAARRLGASFGVSRPVAMNAWAPMDRLLGLSGARAAPEVCIVVGASGAPAFLWGVERSTLIIAVNQDGRAPIAAAADVVVVDEGLAVIEELAGIVEAAGARA